MKKSADGSGPEIIINSGYKKKNNDYTKIVKSRRSGFSSENLEARMNKLRL